MKIFTAKEMKAADEAATSKLGLSSRILMENAGREVCSFLYEKFPEQVAKGVVVLAGPGNNGGDGFVIARTLFGRGLPVEVVLAGARDKLKGAAQENCDSYLQSGGKITEISESNWSDAESVQQLGSFGLVVDALYGTGFRGPVRGYVADLISQINEECEAADLPIVAVDLPSGLEADSGELNGVAISAQATVALQALKLAHVVFPASDHCGEIFTADIGISSQLPEISGVKRELVSEELVALILQQGLEYSPDQHKGERGHLLLIGGGAGHYGALRMSSESALRTGAGLVTMVLPEEAYSGVAPGLLELMCGSLPSDSTGNFSGKDLAKLQDLLVDKEALVIGPGLGRGKGAVAVLRRSLEIAQELQLPVVLDADALNILSEQKDRQKLLGQEMIITPHPGEMARLCGKETAEVQSNRFDCALELSRGWNCVVVLKGARTVIATPSGELYVNPAAVPTLATAGAGDVLAGIIGALLTRGVNPIAASIAAVFVHGCVGELAVTKQGGMVGMIARDIINGVPTVINALLGFDFVFSGSIRQVLPGSMDVLLHQLGEEHSGDYFNHE